MFFTIHPLGAGVVARSLTTPAGLKHLKVEMEKNGVAVVTYDRCGHPRQCRAREAHRSP